jgi:isopenicillin N synthase-like dioxygenase
MVYHSSSFSEVHLDVLAVKNHNISEELIGNALTAAKSFFDLPLDTKMMVGFISTLNVSL